MSRHCLVAGRFIWLVIISLLVGCAHRPALCGEVVVESSIQLPKGRGPVHAVGNNWLRQFVVSRDIPSGTGNPVFVICKEREVWYVDTGSLKIVKRLEYQENESVQISLNGTHIAVFSEFRNRRTGVSVHRMRIEDWTGAKLWEMDYVRQRTCEPTPAGGFVAYPTPHQKDWWMTDQMQLPERIPPRVPHGLLVYDSSGNPVLRGIDYTECRAGICWGDVAPEGKYLGLAFTYVPSEYRQSRKTDGDRACVVMYDIEQGVELWRHYFDGIRPAGILVGPGANRTVCFVTTEGDEFLRAGNYHMYLFDREGNQILEEPVPGCEGIRVPRGLKLSADGTLYAFSTSPPSITVRRLEDGREVWGWGGGPEVLDVGGFGLDPNATVLALVSEGNRELDQFEPKLLFAGPGGRAPTSVDAAFIGRQSTVDIGGVGDGRRFWLVYDNVLRILRYDDGILPGGGD